MSQRSPLWRGVIAEYRDHLPEIPDEAAVSLSEGGTPLLPAPVLSELTGCQVYLKYEGMNPTGSFKDRGMTVAVSRARYRGATTVICASTGNTSASAAAYAARAGLECAVLVPRGKIALGKLAQALSYGATLLQVDGNFDDCLDIVRKLGTSYQVAVVNSVNPDRLAGQKTAAFEIIDALGDAPDVHCLPVGNAGNISAYWMGYSEYFAAGRAAKAPRMFGFQAAGAAPLVTGAPVRDPATIATAIRIGNPASWELAIAAKQASGGLIAAVTDEEILAAYRLLAAREGVFGEPASAAGVAGLLSVAQAGQLRPGSVVVATITGNGLKDPDTAISGLAEPVTIAPDPAAAAAALGLELAVDWLDRPVRVRVPATSANLGPGFDSLGLALSLHDEVLVRVCDDGLWIKVTGEGEQSARYGEGHLVVRALREGFAAIGGQPPGIELICQNAIPHGFGLGSSAAAIVAGLLAARELCGPAGLDLLPGHAVLQIAADLDGHADNAAACLGGGLTIAWRSGSGFRYSRLVVAGGLTPVVCVPKLPLATSAARKVLPPTVPHADAAENAARAALLISALTTDPAPLLDATTDFLHQPYRAAAMPESAELMNALRTAGIPAVISGAGPSVLALTVTGFTPGPDQVAAIAAAVPGWTVLELTVDRQGARAEPA